MSERGTMMALGAAAGGALGFFFWKHLQARAEKEGETDSLDLWVPIAGGAAVGALVVYTQTKAQSRSNPAKCGPFGTASPEAIALLQQIQPETLYKPMRNDFVQIGAVYPDPKTVGLF